MREDPGELTNRFGDEQHKATAREMTGKLLEYARKHQDEYARVPAIQTAMAAAVKN